MDTAGLIDALLDPSTYSHPVDVITTIETHISIVFLTGQYAYKLKKPVNFGFLDFSNKQNRKKYCFLEVELNQRTAPHLYLGVNQINTLNHKISISEASINTNEDAHIEDYLVKMRQFDPNMVLGRLLNQGILDHKMIDALTFQITQFHKKAQTVVQSSKYGSPRAQLQPMLDNFATLQNYVTDKQTQTDLIDLQKWTFEKYNQLESRLSKRKIQGFVKACHGDLHLDNITLIDDLPVLFDGIEFNEAFRWIDVMNDLAFLLIDLEFKQQQTVSYKILSLYLSQTLDYNGLFILNFYRVYRTMVRAKITALRAQQLIKNSYEKNQVEHIANQYIQQAVGYSQKETDIKCILISGVAGSGKSYFANQLLENLPDFNAIIISSDRIRKSLFGLEAQQRSNAQQKQQLYSAQMNQKTYRALADYADICLKNGFNVIIDATFLKQEHRQNFYDLASKNHAKSYLFSLSAEIETTEKAITLRQAENDNPSDADCEVMHNQRKYIQSARPNENALSLKSEDLRQYFPTTTIQNFLNLPIKE
ncbi:bifunctional aminoglycoside phosphotransferase/ATP-binding protein [Thiomicrorhabdus hydrogeniphila]